MNMDLSNMNFMAIAAAGAANFGLGMLWYSPFLFGKHWQKAQGVTEADLKKNNMVAAMGGSFILMTLMAFGIAMFLACQNTEATWQLGAHYGLFVGLMFVAPSQGITNLYGKQSFILWLIDAGYQVTYLTMAGAIVGGWR